jgi:Pyruvate/2-oxoacid:ferredoxin oxidoreductase gamma subunit
MERELIATGIGGQGVQLAAQVLARAAVADGLEVLLFGSYGGMMRGGNTDASLVFAREPIAAPPVVPSCWLGVGMHHEHLPPLLDKLRPDSVLFLNSSVVDVRPDTVARTIEVPATELAVGAGSLMCASIVMLGVVAAATGLVGEAALRGALVDALPSYRQQHVDVNLAALAAGAELGATLDGIEPAWALAPEAA